MLIKKTSFWNSLLVDVSPLRHVVVEDIIEELDTPEAMKIVLGVIIYIKDTDYEMNNIKLMLNTN